MDRESLSPQNVYQIYKTIHLQRRRTGEDWLRSVSTVTGQPKFRGIFGFNQISPEYADMEYSGNELHNASVMQF